jgi:hypothetical protein
MFQGRRQVAGVQMEPGLQFGDIAVQPGIVEPAAQEIQNADTLLLNGPTAREVGHLYPALVDARQQAQPFLVAGLAFIQLGFIHRPDFRVP